MTDVQFKILVRYLRAFVVLLVIIAAMLIVYGHLPE
jgi:hypothetical protein